MDFSSLSEEERLAIVSVVESLGIDASDLSPEVLEAAFQKALQIEQEAQKWEDVEREQAEEAFELFTQEELEELLKNTESNKELGSADADQLNYERMLEIAEERAQKRLELLQKAAGKKHGSKVNEILSNRNSRRSVVHAVDKCRDVGILKKNYRAKKVGKRITIRTGDEREIIKRGGKEKRIAWKLDANTTIGGDDEDDIPQPQIPISGYASSGSTEDYDIPQPQIPTAGVAFSGSTESIPQPQTASSGSSGVPQPQKVSTGNIPQPKTASSGSIPQPQKVSSGNTTGQHIPQPQIPMAGVAASGSTENSKNNQDDSDTDEDEDVNPIFLNKLKRTTLTGKKQKDMAQQMEEMKQKYEVEKKQIEAIPPPKPLTGASRRGISLGGGAAAARETGGGNANVRNARLNWENRQAAQSNTPSPKKGGTPVDVKQNQQQQPPATLTKADVRGIRANYEKPKK